MSGYDLLRNSSTDIDSHEFEMKNAEFSCPHVIKIDFFSLEEKLATVDTNCSICRCSIDNWVCLTCLKSFCSPQSCSRHIATHYDDTHELAFCINDGTCWCSKCNVYIETDSFQSFYSVFTDSVKGSNSPLLTKSENVQSVMHFSIGLDDDGEFDDIAEDDGDSADTVNLVKRRTNKISVESTLEAFYRCFFMSLIAVVVATVVIVMAIRLIMTHPESSDESTNSTNSTKQHNRPNIIMVVADDLGWNSIGNDNFDPNILTPFLDSLAQHDGVVLTNYYSQELCTPARAALLTGRYPSTVGVQFGVNLPTEQTGLNPTEILLPAVMRDLGNYTTVLLGKWHLGHYLQSMLPTARGFDTFFGYLSGQEHYWSKSQDAFPQYSDLMAADRLCYDKYNGVDAHNYSTFMYRDRAVRLIESHRYEANPLFLMFSSQAVHEPYVDRTSFLDGIPMDYLGETAYQQIKDKVVGAKTQQYAMSLLLLDQAVHSMHEAVVRAGQQNNTYIVFVSDNGGCTLMGGRNGPLRGCKGTMFEGGTKVDALIHSPLLGIVPVDSSVAASPPRRYKGLMHVSDWFPTLLSLAGIDSYSPAEGHALDGIDQAAQIRKIASSSATTTIPGDSSSEGPRSHLLYNVHSNVDTKHFDIQVNGSFAVRNEQYKLIHAYSGVESLWYPEDSALPSDDQLSLKSSCWPVDTNATSAVFTRYLFDLAADPNERVNLYGNSSYGTITASLYAMAESYAASAAHQTLAPRYDQKPFPFWDGHDRFYQPWVLSEDQLPRRCALNNSLFGYRS